MVPCDIVKDLQPFIEFITVCPECDIGLGIPRDPIRLINGEKLRLVQPATGEDITEKMQVFVNGFLNNLLAVDGFILKAKSPSCGLGTTKVFESADAEEPLHRHGTGLFAKGILDRLGDIPHIDETSLVDPEKRDHFFTRIFMRADLRLHTSSIQELIDFQTRNKLLLMAYEQRKQKILGRILANYKSQHVPEIFIAYSKILHEMTSIAPSRGNIINAFMHAFGYFSHWLESEKKQYLLDCMEEYSRGRLSMQELRRAFIPYIFEFNVDYLADQTLFYPYPEKLNDPNLIGYE
jgi:uncharacterized protein YbgA (DUF1722 family)/uncharacterized protein YbbK (DUF523 family)